MEVMALYSYILIIKTVPLSYFKNTIKMY